MRRFHSSALPRIMTCQGSVALSDQAPKPDHTDDAGEGTAFHHFAAEQLLGRFPALGDTAPNGHMLDAEMLEHVRAYAAVLKAQPGWIARVEYPLHWGPGGVANDEQPWQVRVKCDAVTWRPDISTLAVTDAKYGFRYVDVVDNWQLLSQAIGACFVMNIRPKRIVLAIYQPRGPGEALRTHTISAAELLAAYSELCGKLSALTNDLVTGPHCRHCPAAAGCPATERAAYNAVDVAMHADTYTPRPETFATELAVLERAAEFLKQRRMWIEGAALASIRDGKPVPGLTSKPVLGHTAWKPEALTQLRNLQSHNQRFFDEVPVTPAEAKRRGLDEEQCKALTYRPARGYKLVTTKKGAADAAKVFGD